MKESITYCKSWFWAKKRPTEIWTETQAKRAHEKGGTYTVVIKNNVRPYAIIVVARNTNFIGVTFLDDFLRSNLSYNFKLIESDMLFLSMATHRDYDSDKDEVTFGTTYIFDSDGQVTIRKESSSSANIE